MLGFQPKYYALDTFNEVQPKSNDTDFLSKTSVALQTSLPKGSIWVMQGKRVSPKNCKIIRYFKSNLSIHQKCDSDPAKSLVISKQRFLETSSSQSTFEWRP